MMRPNHDGLMQAFMTDATERMQALQRARVVLETSPADAQGWNEVRRAAHTIAGNSAMMGFDSLAKAARAMERRAIAVSERHAMHEDVWTLDAERETLERLLRALRAGTAVTGAA